MKLLTCIFFFISIACKAQVPVIEWQHCYGGSSADIGYTFVQTSDSGFIFVGRTDSPDGDVTGFHPGICTVVINCMDYWTIKTDKDGTLQWQKCIGGSLYDEATSIVYNRQSIALAGLAESNDGDVVNSHGLYEGFVVQLDTGGMLMLSKSFGGSGIDVFNAADRTNDSGYIFFGATLSNDGDVSGRHLPLTTQDIWVVKTDSNLNIQWQKCIGGSNVDHCSFGMSTDDGGFFMTGFTNSTDGDISVTLYGDQDFWICKLDSVGSIQWQSNFGGSNYDEVRRATQTQDGGYIMVGITTSNNGHVSGNNGLDDYWVVKVDSLGVFQWQKCLGGSHIDNAWTVDTTIDGGYIVGGICESMDGDVTNSPFPGDNGWIVKLDSSGNIVWDLSIGGSGGDVINCLRSMEDGSTMILGNTLSNNGDVSGNHGFIDLWVVKLSALNDAIHSSENNFTNISVFISSSDLHLSFNASSVQVIPFQYFDVTGRLLLEKNFKTKVGKNEQVIPTRGIKPGIYFARIGTQTCKVVSY